MSVVTDLFSSNEEIVCKKSLSTNEVINEAIIIDAIGKEKLPQFYNHLGDYGKRDGVLPNKPMVPCEPTCRSHVAAVLAMAKEANDPDFQMYMKALDVKNAYFKKLEAKYANLANRKVAEQKAIVDNNARIQDAIAKTDECSQ